MRFVRPTDLLTRSVHWWAVAGKPCRVIHRSRLASATTRLAYPPTSPLVLASISTTHIFIDVLRFFSSSDVFLDDVLQNLMSDRYRCLIGPGSC